MSTELDLTFDKVPIEYPALVKEAILNIHQSHVSSNCASLNEKYCWYLSKTHMFLWDRVKTSSHRASIPTQLALQPSGLPRSAQCVVVYDGVRSSNNKSSYPGVLIASPEGVLRHWTTTQSQNFIELVLDINSEVVLKLELADEPTENKSASFVLTTTSGSVYVLCGEQDSSKSGTLVAHKTCGREAHGIRRRLSSMFGAVSKESTSLVTNTFQFWSRTMKELLVVSVSPDILTVYNVTHMSEKWSLKTKDMFQSVVQQFIETEKKGAGSKATARVVDAAVFREGLMVLVAGSIEDSPTISLYMVYLSPDWQIDTPAHPTWASRVPLPNCRAIFRKNDDTLHLTLCISQRTSEAKTSERTDGIIIVNPFFVQACYVPDNLENAKKWDLTFVRAITIPVQDQLIGISVNKQYTYVMMLNSGISTIRLLPKGFTDGSTQMYTTDTPASAVAITSNEDWAVLSELLSEMVATGLPKTPQFQHLHKSYDIFGEKDMEGASEELKSLKKLKDAELAATIEKFLCAIINYTDAINKTETELHAKRVLTQRMILFLTHMGIYDKVAGASISNSRLSPTHMYRTGLSMLAEMIERVAAASAIWSWKNKCESYSEMYDIIVEKVLKSVPEVQELGLSDKDAFFGRIGMLHYIPRIAMKQLEMAMGKTKVHKYEVFHSVCELLMAIKEGIYQARRMKGAIDKRKGWWTLDAFVDVYKDIATKLCDELKEGTSSESERTRIMVYIASLHDFYLGEVDFRPNEDKIIQELINLGKPTDAMDLAEKHKDFGILVKNYLHTDKGCRQKVFTRFKKMYEKDDFEMYLCEYLKTHGWTDVLMEQRGERVDAYLDNFKELRYTREISNKQYAKAAYTLMSLADAETKKFSRFADFLTRAHFCARAAQTGDEGVAEVLDFYKRRYPELKHRKAIPIEVIKMGYGDELDVMLSIDEMLEWNVAVQPNDDKTVEGYARGFHLLSDLLKVEDSPDLRLRVQRTWKQLIDYDEWNKVKTRNDIENKTIFGKFCEYLTGAYPNIRGGGFPAWMPSERLTIMPTNIDEILEEGAAGASGNQVAWIKSHINSVVDELNKQVNLPKEAFFRPDTENVGSLAHATLDAFKPILESRLEHYARLLDSNSMEA